MSKLELTPEMFAGNFIQELEPKVIITKSRPKGQKRRYVLLRCLHCSTAFEVSLANAKRTKQECCSRQCAHNMVQVFEGGNEKHPLYIRWLSMKQRVNNPNHESYHLYGGRGITIAEDLLTFEGYVRYLEALPNYPESFPTQLTVDRIDTDGNYERGNLRWVSQSVQLVNQRKQQGQSSKYIGVCFDVKRGLWVASVTYEKTTLFKGLYDSEELALEARNQYLSNSNLPHKVQSL